jgi:hypothetical protein
MADRVLTVQLIGDASSLNKAFSSAGAGAGKLGSALGNVASIASGFVVAQGLMQLPGLLGGAMDAASDFNETLSKSNTVFGDNAKAIEDWASGAAKSFGQSKTQALDAASSFGNMFVQLGIGSGKAADMSRSMTELASDFASFHNADISEVISAQTAAFRGEYDAVQRFVPTINAAAVEQQAMKMGLAATTKELDAQDKALATQALLLAGAGDAMGDFDRTSEGAANKSRILSAQMAEMSVTIGQQLLPVKVALMDILLNKVIPAFGGLVAAITPVIEKVKWVIEAFTGTVRTGEEVEMTADNISERMATLIGYVQQLGQWVHNVLIPAFKQFVAEARPRIEEFAAVVAAKFAEFQVYYERDVKPALDNVIAAFHSVVSWVQQHWPEIMAVIGPVLDQIQSLTRVTFAVITGLIDAVIQLLGGDFTGAWQALKGVVGALGDYVAETAENVKALLSGLAGALFDIGVHMMERLAAGIRGGLGHVGGAINDAIARINPLNWDIPGLSPFKAAFKHAGQIAGGNLVEGMQWAVSKSDAGWLADAVNEWTDEARAQAGEFIKAIGEAGGWTVFEDFSIASPGTAAYQGFVDAGKEAGAAIGEGIGLSVSNAIPTLAKEWADALAAETKRVAGVTMGLVGAFNKLTADPGEEPDHFKIAADWNRSHAQFQTATREWELGQVSQQFGRGEIDMATAQGRIDALTGNVTNVYYGNPVYALTGQQAAQVVPSTADGFA